MDLGVDGTGVDLDIVSSLPPSLAFLRDASPSFALLLCCFALLVGIPMRRRGESAEVHEPNLPELPRQLVPSPWLSAGYCCGYILVMLLRIRLDGQCLVCPCSWWWCREGGCVCRSRGLASCDLVARRGESVGVECSVRSVEGSRQSLHSSLPS